MFEQRPTFFCFLMLISWAGLKRKVNIVNYIYCFHLITSEDRDDHYRPQKSKLAGLIDQSYAQTLRFSSTN